MTYSSNVAILLYSLFICFYTTVINCNSPWKQLLKNISFPRSNANIKYRNLHKILRLFNVNILNLYIMLLFTHLYHFFPVSMSPVSSVFHTEITVNVGLKNTVREVTSIPSIRCLCYKPEHFSGKTFSWRFCDFFPLVLMQE